MVKKSGIKSITHLNIPPKKINMSPKKGPFRKEIHLPTTFLRRHVSFQGSTCQKILLLHHLKDIYCYRSQFLEGQQKHRKNRVLSRWESRFESSTVIGSNFALPIFNTRIGRTLKDGGVLNIECLTFTANNLRQLDNINGCLQK